MNQGLKGKMALAVLAISVFSVEAAEVVSVPPWELHNSFWMSLHHTLMEDITHPSPSKLQTLTTGEQATWNEALAAYRNAVGNEDITFARSIIITNDALTQVRDDAREPLIDAPLADALNRAAPIYRKYWWEGDDRSNRFFISYASAILREGAAELIEAHETVYRTKWPEKIRLYISPFGGPFGAYTMTGKVGGVITTMSSRDPGYQGLRALEMIFHEGSHAIVNPMKGTVADAISAAAKRSGVEAPRDLWHAILFATSSELTRQFLVKRGVSNFAPSSDDMFTRVWPKYREAIQKYWLPYLNGHGTLEEAIGQIVGAISSPH